MLFRSAWLDAAGARAWPVLGAVYLVEAVKRVRGMRLLGLARRSSSVRQAAPAVVANRLGLSASLDRTDAMAAPRQTGLRAAASQTEPVDTLE